MKRALALCLLATAAYSAVQAQDLTTAPGAVLRGLDKVSGAVTDIEIGAGATVTLGRLEITLSECRYPAGDPAFNAYAHLVIRDPKAADVAFYGWMIATSPALNALDHPRYDVWVLRCTTSAAAGTAP